MGKWRDPRLVGWTPKRDVGVGADFWSDPFGSTINALLTPPGSDQSFTDTFPSLSQQPLEAAGAGIMAGLQLPQEVVKAGTGMVIGGMQALGQAVGANPSNQPLDVRSRIPDTNLAPLQQTVRQVVGPGVMGDAVASLVPNRLNQMFSALDTAGRPKTLSPVQNAGQILDPQTARARFSAVAPPVLELGTDLLSGFVGPSMAAKALGKAGPALRAASGFDTYGSVVPLGQQAGRLAGIDDLPTAVKTWLATDAGKKAHLALNLAPPLLGGLGMAATTQATDQAPVGSTEWFQHAGQRAIVGSVLGWATTALGAASLRVLTAGAINGTVEIAASTPPLTKALLEGQNDARRVIANGSVTPIAYPGAWLGRTINAIREQFSDHIAGLKAAESTSLGRIESGKAYTDASSQLIAHKDALDEFRQATLPGYVQARDAAEAAHTQAIQATRTALAAQTTAENTAETAAAAARRRLPTAAEAYTSIVNTPTDAFSVGKIVGSATEATDANGNAVRRITLAPGMTAEMVGADPHAAVWRPNFGPPAMQQQTFTPEGLLQATKQYATLELQGGANYLTSPANRALHLTRQQEMAATKAAAEQARIAHEAAAAAETNARGPLDIARKEWLGADKIDQFLSRRVDHLQEYVDRGIVRTLPHDDLFGKQAQMLNGIDASRQDMADKMRRNLYSRVRQDSEIVGYFVGPDGRLKPNVVPYEYGIGGNADMQSYNTWRTAAGVYSRALDGHASVLTSAKGAVPATVVRTVDRAEQLYNETVQNHLKLDDKTLQRYIRTLGKETEYSNGFIDQLHTEGFLTKADRDNIKAQPFYIRANVLSDIVQNWNESAPLKATRLFAGSKGIEEEHNADQVWSATTEDLINRNALLMQLIQQNRVAKAIVRTARADPMGLGTLVTKNVSNADAALRSFATRADEVYGDLLRTQRQEAMLLRKTTGAVGGKGPLNSAVNKAERYLKTAQDAHAANPTPATQARVQKWTQEYTRAKTDLTAADAQLQAVQQQKPLLEIQHEQMQAQAKLRENAAPQEAWRRSIEAKQARAAELRGQADDATAEATAARTPKRQQELLARAETLREQAVKQDALAEKVRTAGLPKANATVELPAGFKALPVFENGASEIYTVPDWMHSQLVGQDTPQIDAFTRFMNTALGKFWRASVTTLSPAFAFRNVPRDFQTALVNYAGHGSVADFLGHYVKAWQDVLGTAAGRGLEDVFAAVSRSNFAGQGERAGKLADELDRLITLKSDTERFSRQGGSLGTYVESQGGGIFLHTPLDLIRKMSLIFEMPARVAVFKGKVAAGASAAEAAYYGRTLLTDFSKAGHAMRVANLFLPLLNARVQGQLQEWESFRKSPQAFLAHSTLAIAMPYITSYVWNRTQFGDLMDQIPTSVLSRNGVVIYSKYFNDRTQREEPLYFKVPFSEVGQQMSVPLRYLLDQQYHQESQSGTPLDPAHRSVWSPAGVLRQVISSFIPTNPQPNELDPMGLLWSTIAMNPGGAAYSGILSNWDRFRGRPVVAEEEAALWDQYRWAPPDTSTFAQVATELLSGLGVGKGHLAPAQVDFVLRTMTGSLMQPPAALAMDSMAREYWKATHGNQPLPSERTLSPADLANAPTSFAKYVNQAKLPDNRPWMAQTLGFLFGAGGSAQSITERVQQDDPRRYDQWMATRKYQDETTEWDQTVYQPALKAIYAHTGDWSMAKINDEVTTLGKQRQAIRARIQSENLGAITDPVERRKFIDAVPGLPIDPEGAQGLMSLPPGTDISALEKRFMSPPSVPASVFAGMNPQQQQDYRNRELQAIARDLSNQGGTPVSPDAVQRAIAAKQRGITLPALPLPEVYVDDWLAAWRSPEGYQPGDPPELMRAAREAELDKIVGKYHVAEEMRHAGILDPTKDPQEQAKQAVMETINSRFLPPGEVLDLDVSRDRAYAVSSFVHDETEFPSFLKPNGEAFGDPAQRADWAQQLAKWDRSGRDKDTWPAEMRLLDHYRSLADVQKVNELYNNPDYLHYSRWFGVGRTMTPDQWNAYQSGAVPKYTTDGTPRGRAIAPGVAIQFDHIAALYQALPDGPQKTALQWKVKRIRQMAVPNWQTALDTYELMPDSQRSLQADLLRIDAQREAQQRQNDAQYQEAVSMQ